VIPLRQATVKSEVGDGDHDPERRAGRASSQFDQRCDERDAKHAGVPLRRLRIGELRAVTVGD